VDDRRCTAPAEVQEEDRLRILLQHSTLSPYSLNANFWRAKPLASNHLCSSPRCLAEFIALVGRWLHEGVLVGERELQCREGGAAGPMIHHLWTLTALITAPEAVVRQLLRSVSPGTPVDKCGRSYMCGHTSQITVWCTNDVEWHLGSLLDGGCGG
jgi:hypothetical protein